MYFDFCMQYHTFNTVIVKSATSCVPKYNNVT